MNDLNDPSINNPTDQQSGQSEDLLTNRSIQQSPYDQPDGNQAGNTLGQQSVNEEEELRQTEDYLKKLESEVRQKEAEELHAIQEQKTQKLAESGKQTVGMVFGNTTKQAISLPDEQQQSQAGTAGRSDKEREPLRQGGDAVPAVSYQEQEKIPENVESWIEKINTADDIQIPQQVMDDDEAIIIDEPELRVIDDAIILPLTQEEVKDGLHHKVTDSFRWLAEWVVKVIKAQGDKVFYKEENVEA